MRKKKQNIKASQRRKGVPPNKRKAIPIAGQDRAEQSEDRALADEVEGSLGFYLEDIFQKVVEIEEEALKSHDEDEP